MCVCLARGSPARHQGRGTKDQKKFLPPWNAERLLPVLPVKTLIIRAAIFDAQGEISLIQLSALFSLSALVTRKGAIIGQFMRPKRPADARSLTSCWGFFFFLQGTFWIQINSVFVITTADCICAFITCIYWLSWVAEAGKNLVCLSRTEYNFTVSKYCTLLEYLHFERLSVPQLQRKKILYLSLLFCTFFQQLYLHAFYRLIPIHHKMSAFHALWETGWRCQEQHHFGPDWNIKQKLDGLQ